VIVRDAPTEHYGWLAERATLVIGDQFRAIEAIDDAGRIHGMVGFDGWMPNAVSMHVALENPAALRSVLRTAFRIAFLVADKGVARAYVLSTNTRSLALVARLGFTFAYRSVNGWAKGVDIILFEMRREDCRWLNPARKAA
jgi:hypothetical protein